MAWNQFIGITMLLYALSNPIGAVPIFLAMTRQAGSVKTHRVIILASAAVAICTPARSWLTILNAAPCPGASPATRTKWITLQASNSNACR